MTAEPAAPAFSPCSVARRCSSVGLACEVDDRACQDLARERGLEITCERVDPRGYVYCPPGAQQRDSNVVWVLLAVATVVAVGGLLAAWLGFRRKKPR